MTELGSTPTLRCGHCGNRAPLKIRARDSRIETHGAEATSARSHTITWDAGRVYEIATCPACEGTLLVTYDYHEVFDTEGVDYKVLYPVDRSLPEGLPENVLKAYDAAQRVKNV